jgi:microcystin-dependent protein
MFAGNFAPRGYALCQGQTMSIQQNAALFAILGTTYGGNGVTTFQLPDLRGRGPVHAANGPGIQPVVLGQAGGTQNATLTIGNMPSHNHNATVKINAAADGRAGTDNPAGAVPDTGSGLSFYAASPDGTTKMNAGMATMTVGVAGGSVPVSIMNPYLGINYIIALVGIFPSRN